MFAQLPASRPARRRSPSGVAASVTLHGILVAGAVLVTSGTSPRLAHVTDLTVSYVTPPVSHPTSPAPVGAVPSTPVVTPNIIGVSIAVPDALPPTDLLRTIINTDEPFQFRVGVPTSARTPGIVLASPDMPLSVDQVEVPVTLDARSPVPLYPQLLKDAGIEGSVRLRFVVDTLGRVELGTVQIAEATHPAFAMAVQAVLPRLRFTPARVGEHRVRQLVEFPLQFRLKR